MSFKSIVYDVCFFEIPKIIYENYKALKSNEMMVTFRKSEKAEYMKVHEKMKITKAIKECCSNAVNEHFSAGKSMFDEDNRPKNHRVNGEINDSDES